MKYIKHKLGKQSIKVLALSDKCKEYECFQIAYNTYGFHCKQAKELGCPMKPIKKL